MACGTEGTTFYAETEVLEKHESKSRPGEGIVTFAHTSSNQHGDIVATASRKTMVRKKPAEESPERFEKAAAAADS